MKSFVPIPSLVLPASNLQRLVRVLLSHEDCHVDTVLGVQNIVSFNFGFALSQTVVLISSFKI